MESIWTQICNHREKRPALDRQIEADVAVIGGGMAGILTAWQLEQAGVRTVVLEADQIGQGQTKNTTAKITAQHGLFCHTFLEKKGEEPEETANVLKRGYGAIVETSQGKMGVYKSEEGEMFKVDIVCPHLGCELTWNPDEQSWDCPCHGSRFDVRGNLLDGPAQEGIQYE